MAYVMMPKNGEVIWSEIAKRNLTVAPRSNEYCKVGTVECFFDVGKDEHCEDHSCTEGPGPNRRYVIWCTPEQYPIARLTR